MLWNYRLHLQPGCCCHFHCFPEQHRYFPFLFLPLPLDGAKRTKKEEVLCNFNDIFYYQLFVTNNTTIIHSPAASLSAFSFKAFTPANGNNRRDLSKNFDAFAYSPFDKNTCKYKLTIVKVLNYVESFHTHLRHVTTLFGFTLVSNTSSLNN